MGYVHDTQMSQFVPPSAIIKSAGTWTDSVVTNRPVSTRTAGAAAFTLMVPALIMSNAAALKGAQLKSIDLFWTSGTADFTDVNTVEIDKVTLAANSVICSGAAVTGVVIDGGNDTNAKRITQASHTMNVALPVPAWIANGEAYYLVAVFNAAGATTFVLTGARVNYTLRA